MYKKWIDILYDSEFFKNISKKELQTMLECMGPKIRTYKKDNIIGIDGNKIDGIYVLLSGSILVAKFSTAGERVIIREFYPGTLFEETGVLSGRNVWPATFISKTESSVLIIPPERIINVCPRSCECHKQILRNSLKILANKTLLLNKRIEYLSIRDLKSRISIYLLDYYRKTNQKTFLLPMNRYELADFLNTRRPSLSRELSRMKKEGLIDYHKSSFKVIDVKRLEIYGAEN